MSRTAIILFNLGGPDRPEAVAPFLVNLFSDAAIIGLSQPLRWLVARVIAARRAKPAQEIYDKIGGGSPLLANTEAQAAALGEALGEGYRVFVAMRYWHPMSLETARAVKAWRPDQILLLPLYPQFSSTTTGSSITAWRQAARSVGLTARTRTLCCYPTDGGFVQAVVEGLQAALAAQPEGWPVRILFSAHGLPKRIVAAGDPYQFQVEASVAAVREALGRPDLDAVICYQSRVGRLEWIGPSTEEEIKRAGAEGMGLVIVPIAFVSEHSETLVELDILYRELAAAAGVPAFTRVPTVALAPPFIRGLAALVHDLEEGRATLRSGEGGRICPRDATRCLFGHARRG